LLGESGANLLVIIGISEKGFTSSVDIDELIQFSTGLPRKVILAKLRALKAAGLIYKKEKEELFFLTNQGKTAFRSLMKLYEL
jgi:predicted transcriptional regulator